MDVLCSALHYRLRGVVLLAGAVISVAQSQRIKAMFVVFEDGLCGLVVRVLGYRSGGPDSIPGTVIATEVVCTFVGTVSRLFS
jgi:hypothetical protein